MTDANAVRKWLHKYCGGPPHENHTCMFCATLALLDERDKEIARLDQENHRLKLALLKNNSKRERLVQRCSRMATKAKDQHNNILNVLSQRDAARAEVERKEMQIVACGTIASHNTPETFAANRLPKDHPYWSQMYDDVCAAVQREMELRAEVERLRSEHERDLLRVTEGLDEHPDDWDGPCWCAVCRSYADPDEDGNPSAIAEQENKQGDLT